MRSLILLSIMSLLAASIPARQGRDGRQFTIYVAVDLVVFNLTVKDKAGRQKSGLKATDFRVYEGGRLQDITLFSAENVPASVGLIIDNNGSMLNKRAAVNKAAFAFVKCQQCGRRNVSGEIQ